jgi:hypothetical protein
MEDIYETNDTFDFTKLILSTPVSVSNGNFFIRFLINNTRLYIQPPKCSTKQGILKSGKKFYTDLIFTNENENFIRWMENLESYCQKTIYNNREHWFEGDMEMDDIENYFTSVIKIYKSGKYCSVRANISTGLGKPLLKIYDENGNDVDMNKINEHTNVMTILEISGIKCSTKSFQIEVELKQMMCLNQNNIFEKILLTNPQLPVSDTNAADETPVHDTNIQIKLQSEENNNDVLDMQSDMHPEKTTNTVLDTNDTTITNKESVDEFFIKENNLEKTDEIEEIDFTIESLSEDTVHIKERNEIYYNLYREAKKKAKIAREFALSAYLEAKQIKNTYKLDDVVDSDESDLEQIQ